MSKREEPFKVMIIGAGSHRDYVPLNLHHDLPIPILGEINRQVKTKIEPTLCPSFTDYKVEVPVLTKVEINILKQSPSAWFDRYFKKTTNEDTK